MKCPKGWVYETTVLGRLREVNLAYYITFKIQTENVKNNAIKPKEQKYNKIKLAKTINIKFMR